MPNEFPKSLLAAALAAAYPAVGHAQTAARVDFASGNVTASTADGRSRQLARGADVQVGETVNTQDGRAQMRFTDGAYVSLQPQTQFRIDSYVFEGRGTPKESAVMSLLRGGMRTITGLVGRTNREGYRLQTTTATVGIRGTEFNVAYDTSGSVTMFVAGGTIAVTNGSGTTEVPGGHSVIVTSNSSAPQTTNEKPFLPPDGTTPHHVTLPQNPIQDANPFVQAILSGVDVGAPVAVVYTQGPSPTSLISDSATLNSSGALTAYSYTTNNEGPVVTNVTNGSALPQSAGNDGVIAWGRWVDGTDNQGNNLAGGRPLHYVVGLPVTNMPTTGTASYDIIGATAACNFNCGQTAVTSSTLAVNFGAANGTFTMGMLIGGAPMSGGGNLTFRSGTLFDANGSIAGNSMYGAGFFAGPAASRAGMAYNVNYEGYGGGGNISGVMAYKKR